tara:strand:+ start:1210 stop:1371 length:162 start_codon:yes stop_codon:yes gene_type:complete
MLALDFLFVGNWFKSNNIQNVFSDIHSVVLNLTLLGRFSFKHIDIYDSNEKDT